MKPPRLALPLLLAIGWTGLNAFKPPVIDDTAYLALARQMTKAPLDPYGFEQFWYQTPLPANHVLAPPVLPYWLSVGMRVFGEDMILLKLWLFPFAALLTLALDSLLRRFACGAAAPVLTATVLSPALLPAFNFMLDVPALTLTLTAVVIFLKSLDKNSTKLALLAGLTAGLAAQTKYTGLLALPLFVGISFLHRRVVPGLLAALTAGAVFAAWELYMDLRYGESHFLFALRTSNATWHDKLGLVAAGVVLLGGVAPGVTLLALAGLGLRRVWVIATALTLAAGYAALALIPDTRSTYWLPEDERHGIGALNFFLGACGWGVLVGVVGTVSVLLLRRRQHGRIRSLRWPLPSSVLVLLLWLAVEVVGYYALTQFPASRRVMGMTVVAYLLVGRLVSRTCRSAPRRKAVWLAAGAGAVLGLFYAGIDLADARIEPGAVREAAAFIRQREREPTVWFTGHWGLQNEATRQGFRPLVPGQSHVQAGDWLLIAPPWMPRQEFVADARQGAPVHIVRIDRRFRLRTLPAYYGGQQPIEWWPSPLFEMKVYQVTAPWVPESP